jgi:hypothetical protein
LKSFKSHIEGKNATVEVYADRVEWTRPRGLSAAKLTAGLMTGGASFVATGVRSGKAGTEMIPVKSISSVTTKRDGLLYTKVSAICSGNTIDFRVSHAEAQPIKELLTSLVLGTHPAQQAGSPQAASQTPAAVVAPDAMEQLRKLGELHQAGILTEEEFQAKKSELLRRL